jgi:5'-nucleotidase
MVYRDHYNVEEELSDGSVRYMVEGVFCSEAEDDTDYRALLDRYVSIGYVRNIS